jgi:3-oxoacyl-[acyl-carrier protein] reductase
VTGAAQAIGGAIARSLHAGRRPIRHTKEALDALAAALGDRVHVLPCDLADKNAVELAGAECRRKSKVGLQSPMPINRDNLFVNCARIGDRHCR